MIKIKDAFEIRFHARSGQGAKTAAQFIAEAALEQKKEIQAFAEYTAERTGSPMKTFVRLAKREIKTHEPIVHPNVVIVLDQSLIESIPVAEGLEKDGILLINSAKDSKHFKKIIKTKARIHTIDATGISLSLLKANFPNMPLLGALIKLTNIISLEALANRIMEKYLKKLGREKTEANIEAVKRGFEEA